ncbi:MAG TPA: 3-phosphoshikimate 1-carboxyvinyltransferase, partial [Candidatus Eisenbacteria bacterium]|nr:3-phosphoshikimate 1-carboxyvinyltransferase [Candidatus Eisenbacteria bacterium]
HTMEVPSAQVKSALLVAGLLAEGETWIGNTAGSRDHTERMLPSFGANVASGPDWVSIHGPRSLRSISIVVPGDISAAAFFLVAAAIRPGSQVTLEGAGLNPTRTKVLDVMKRMGLDLIVVPDVGGSPEPSGTIHVSAKTLQGTDVTADDVPHLIDELPALAVLAAFANGTSTVRGAAELRHKESNRLEAMAEGLNALGARVTLESDGWTIEGSGGKSLAGGAVRSRGDHRVAMSLLVAGLGSKTGCAITDLPLIETSDPFFAHNLNRILEHA